MGDEHDAQRKGAEGKTKLEEHAYKVGMASLWNRRAVCESGQTFPFF